MRMVMTHRNAPRAGHAAMRPFRSQYCARPAGADRPGDPPLRRAGGAGRRRRPSSRRARRRVWSRSRTPSSRGSFDFAAHGRIRRTPRRRSTPDCRPTRAVGDFDAGFAGAAVKIDQRYTTPYQFSQPMEPNACLAVPARRGPDRLRQRPDRRRGPHARSPARCGSTRQRVQHRHAVRRRRVRLQARHPLARRSWRRSPPASWTSRSRSR